jgi:hypothetical protein
LSPPIGADCATLDNAFFRLQSGRPPICPNSPQRWLRDIMSLFVVVVRWVADMERSLIWIESDVNGWACSNCRWKFPVPTLLSGEEAKGAYDRLAAAKFRQHMCESATTLSAMQEAKKDSNTAFAERARTLIKRGYKPKVAVELVLQETEIEHGNDPRMMEKARADADDFLDRVRKGLI